MKSSIFVTEADLRSQLQLPLWLSFRRNLLFLLLLLFNLQAKPQRLPTAVLAQQYFGNDAPWYQANIPFFEIDDPELQQIYYYRWQLFRSHLRDLGPERYMVTEFLPEVPWGRPPYTDLNDSSSFHLLEARWLRDPRYAESLIDHLYSGGGNDRHFSESIAAATYAVTQVTGDTAPALRHLDTMQYVYNAWDDHFDRIRNLYWIEPLLDATEYTIASIDASGAGFTDTPSTDQNKNGFTQGYAYRPTIDAYQYGNAQAIAALARQAGQTGVAEDYEARARRLRDAVLQQLWNPKLHHFTDVYQRSTKTVIAGDFIRGRELAGYLPWQFGLPTNAQAVAWQHLTNPGELAGPKGLRTVEPSYPKYMQQYRYEGASPECQWNGPSWPFQTSQTLTALANLIDDYTASPVAPVTADDYYRLLKQYTHQHFLNGHPDLQEDYNPDTGAVIVGLARSHHYNHSTYNDLILSGLVGIRPTPGNRLTISPILPAALRYFAVEKLQYHGHTLALYYDRAGTRYHFGPGLTLFVDGTQAAHAERRISVDLKTLTLGTRDKFPLNMAANPGLAELPQAIASSTLGGTSAMQAIDGRLWYFPEILNGWSPLPADPEPTFTLDFQRPVEVGSVELYFADAPKSYRLQRFSKGVWRDLPSDYATPILTNGKTRIDFIGSFAVERLRMIVPASAGAFRLIELKAYAATSPIK